MKDNCLDCGQRTTLKSGLCKKCRKVCVLCDEIFYRIQDKETPYCTKHKANDVSSWVFYPCKEIKK